MAIDTSAAYKAAIKADTELTRFEAQFGFIPDGAREGAVPASSDESDVSCTSQVNDDIKSMPALSSLEQNRWVLNGAMKIIPDDVDSVQVGYWSGSMCDENGDFSDPKPHLDYPMDTEYDIIGITLYFDDACEEWATSVTIQYYDDTDTLIDEDTFANDGSEMMVNFAAVGVNLIRVYFNSWNMPERYAKVCELLPGEVFVFDPENTFSFELTESIQPFDTSLELPEFTITFDNSDKNFDVVNPAGLMYYLRQLMQIAAKIGILETSVYEYITAGDFYVYSWPDTSQEDTAQLTCKPLLAFKDNVYYEAPGTGTQTVAAAAAVIFSLAGITDYTIDAALQGISVNQYIGEDVPLVNALAQLAIAAGGYWKFERDGSYSLKEWGLPAASNSIDYENMWSKPNIEQSKKITSVNIKYYTYDSGTASLIENDNVVTAATNDGGAADDICSTFIPSAARASAIGALALSYYAMRLSHEISYRGDMSIEPGDVVTTENDYADSDVLITSHTINWDAENKLSGELKGLGVV